MKAVCNSCGATHDSLESIGISFSISKALGPDPTTFHFSICPTCADAADLATHMQGFLDRMREAISEVGKWL
jgi:hypothetical protein